jgi:hypothetical protein
MHSHVQGVGGAWGAQAGVLPPAPRFLDLQELLLLLLLDTVANVSSHCGAGCWWSVGSPGGGAASSATLPGPPGAAAGGQGLRRHTAADAG